MLGVLAVAGLLVLMSSCKKECTCTEKSSDSKETYTFTEYPENYNAKSCKELASMMSGEGYVYSCK